MLEREFFRHLAKASTIEVFIITMNFRSQTITATTTTRTTIAAAKTTTTCAVVILTTTLRTFSRTITTTTRTTTTAKAANNVQARIYRGARPPVGRGVTLTDGIISDATGTFGLL